VAVLTTGDELAPSGSPLAPGEIYDSNGPMLAAALKRAGAIVTSIAAAADTPEAHRAALGQALDHDVVISTGGVSVGPHDLVRGIGAELGVQELFWRVKMRPGKPLSFGVRDATLVFGIPGNPVSVLVCFELFVTPALAALQGAVSPRPRFTRARLATAVTQNRERDDLIRVTVNSAGTLDPVRDQQSHQISITATADGLARIPTGTGELPAGSDVAYLPLTYH
jgi:molybdopterin molybdotransferase